MLCSKISNTFFSFLTYTDVIQLPGPLDTRSASTFPENDTGKKKKSHLQVFKTYLRVCGEKEMESHHWTQHLGHYFFH